MKKDAEIRVAAANPGATKIRAGDGYPNFLGGTLVDVIFENGEKDPSINHVLYGETVKLYRVFHDVCEDISKYKERRLFFRFLEFAGVGGFIATFLTILFAILLCVLAIWGKDTNASILEIVTASFTLILGYFFDSQSRKET